LPAFGIRNNDGKTALLSSKLSYSVTRKL